MFFESIRLRLFLNVLLDSLGYIEHVQWRKKNEKLYQLKK